MENSGILLVDDEPAYHAIVTALLSHCMTIDCVGSAAAAVDAVCARRYDLIISDIEMPGGDGYQVAADIRAAADWARRVPIVAFTSLQPANGERHFRDRGFDGWLAKPFSAGNVFDLVRPWLARGVTSIDIEDRRDRLADLLGAEQADAMIARLFASLGDAIVTIDAGGDASRLGHDLGGLAGMLGFAALSAGWLSLQDSGLAAWPTVCAMTREAIARFEHRRDGIGA